MVVPLCLRLWSGMYMGAVRERTSPGDVGHNRRDPGARRGVGTAMMRNQGQSALGGGGAGTAGAGLGKQAGRTPLTATRDAAHCSMAEEPPAWSRRSVMETRYEYHATATWTEHRRGLVETESIARTINFSAPPEFGGEPGLWTPEHLLVAAVSTCFVSTFRAVAELSKVEVTSMRVAVEGILEKTDGGFRLPS